MYTNMSSPRPRILIILTSSEHGWYLPELAHPYEILAPACDITIASPLGGVAPLDQGSVEHLSKDEICMRFFKDHRELWENTATLENFLGRAHEFAAIFYIGGYGPMFDLAHLESNKKLIQEFHAEEKILCGVCHGSAVYSHVKIPVTDTYVLDGHKVTGISDHELSILSAPAVEPFSVEISLREATGGGGYEKAEKPFDGWVVSSKGKDNRIVITGQNLASGLGIGKAIWEALFGRPYEELPHN